MISFRVSSADPSDLAHVLDLLQADALPVVGLSESLPRLLVARARATIVGCCALEVHGRSGLLRSLAVDLSSRRMGVGAALVEGILSRAERESLSELFLLTTTARAYFPRFGFETHDRGAAPPEIRDSWEFRTGCPASATLMRKSLKAE